MKDIICHKFLESYKTINSEHYQQQLIHLSEKIERKRSFLE